MFSIFIKSCAKIDKISSQVREDVLSFLHTSNEIQNVHEFSCSRKITKVGDPAIARSPDCEQEGQSESP